MESFSTHPGGGDIVGILFEHTVSHLQEVMKKKKKIQLLDPGWEF